MTSSNPATESQLKHIASPDAADACKKTGHRCQSILEHLYDSYHGFKACADDCKDIALKTHFQTVAAIRFDFIDQLSSFLWTEFDLEPVTSGSGLAVAHQKWIDVKAWFTDGRDKGAIIAEVHRCETHLIQQYTKTLSEPAHLSDTFWRVLQDQLKTIREQDAALHVL